MAPSRQATVRFAPLRSCLVSLPLALHNSLLNSGTPVQQVCIELGWTSDEADGRTGAGRKGKERAREPERVTVGWTGLPASASTAAAGVAGVGSLEIDPQFARELGLREGQSVQLQLLNNLSTCATVNVSPLSADDWELLEANAEFVESHLLSQVRAVRVGQTVCVWVGRGRSLIRFSVDSLDPETDDALRLHLDTEVIVAPKTRIAPGAAKHDVAAVEAPTASTSNRLYRVLPEPCASTSPLVHVSSSAFFALSAAHPSTRCSVVLQPRPRKSRSGKDEGEEGKAAPAAVEADLKTVEGVYFEAVDTVPADYVALSRDVLSGLGLPVELATDGSAGYALVRCIASPPQPNGAEAPSTDAVKSVTPVAEPSPPLPQLAGVQQHIDRSVEFIATALATRSDSSRALCLLLHGASGSGKTSVARAVARLAALDPRIRAHVSIIDCAKHQDDRPAVLRENVREWLDDACWHAPSLLVLDNLDRIVPAEVEHIDPFRSQQTAHAVVSAIASALADRPIVVLATAAGPQSLHSLLSSAHLFGERIKLASPDKAARREIMSTLVQAKAAVSSLRPSERLDYVALATTTDGYLPADLSDLVDRAIHSAAIRSIPDADLALEPADFARAQSDFVPLSLKDVKLQKSDVAWADIGGLHETRRVLRETLEWPTRYGAIFARSPLRLRSGLLLYGYPGCGKTLLASAVAKECGLNFISVKGPELLNKYIGASEKSVRDLFERASSARPCVLFLDEFDSLAPKRGHDSTGVTDRVVNQLLTQMDGAEGLEGVYVLAATSRPDLIDPALLRPGRLDRSLICDMPAHGDRLEIMQACARKIQLAPSIDLDEFAHATAGYSGADLQALIYNAHLDAVHATLPSSVGASGIVGAVEDRPIEYISFGGPATNGTAPVLSRAEQAQVNKRLQTMLGSTERKSTAVVAAAPKRVVERKHLRRALQSTRPSVPREELVRLGRIYADFVSARSSNGGLPNGEASDEIGGRASLM